MSGYRVDQDLAENSPEFRLPVQWNAIDIYKRRVFNDLARWPIPRESTATEEMLYEEDIDIVFCRFGVLDGRRLVARQNSSGTEQAVAALEGQWLKAQKTSNPDLLAPLLEDKFVNISTDGTVSNKEETLALVKSGKWSSADYVDVKITVFGDTAIARGDFRGKGTDASGKPVEVNERWTDTWVKMANGKWQCVVSHASPIKI